MPLRELNAGSGNSRGETVCWGDKSERQADSLGVTVRVAITVDVAVAVAVTETVTVSLNIGMGFLSYLYIRKCYLKVPICFGKIPSRERKSPFALVSGK